MLVIIDYRAGNLTSVRLAFETLGIEACVTDNPGQITSADHIVFPGVGAAASAMATLKELQLIEPIRRVVADGIPFLGICLGTQIILEHSEEDDGTDCIGLLPGSVRLFRPSDRADKVPQMGWNSVRMRKEHAVLEGITDESEFYFVHSYYPVPVEEEDILGETTYAATTFASILGRKNVVATQFHPEKSGRIGLRLLQNFAAWNGER